MYFILIESEEFDFKLQGDGRSALARYANNSNYRNDSLIQKESACNEQRSSKSLTDKRPQCVSAL